MNIDIIRIFAFIFIVMLHTLNRQYGLNIWMGGYAVISIGVNLFIMISGYLLLDKSEPVKDFFRKRFLNILPLFLVFNIIYYYLSKMSLIRNLEGEMFIVPHFWYIYMILGMYLLTPWLRKVLAHAEKETIYVIVLWFLSNILNPYLKYFNLRDIPFSNFPISGFIGYYLLGYYFKKYRDRLKKVPFIYIAAVYVTGFLISVLTVKYILSTTGKREISFFDKNSLGTFLMSVSFFVFWLKFEFKKRNRIVKIIADSTYFAFLVHLIVLDMAIKVSDEMIFKSVVTIVGSIMAGILYSYLSGLSVKVLKKGS